MILEHNICDSGFPICICIMKEQLCSDSKRVFQCSIVWSQTAALHYATKKKDTRVLNCKISQDPLWEANNSLSQTSTPRPWGRCCYKSREPHFHACTAARDRRVGASRSHYRAPKSKPNEKRNDQMCPDIQSLFKFAVAKHFEGTRVETGLSGQQYFVFSHRLSGSLM